MVTKFHLFENLNYAKSILRKKGIDDKDPNFLKIREIAKEKPGYLGLLTKLHFNDNVPLEELPDILSSLVELNINVNDVLNKDYIQLSDHILDKKSIQADNGYKLQFSDGNYDYFRVFTYDGILNCGSPAWCIKTKSNWDAYTSNNPEKNQQWVIIKKINKKLLTPNTNYLDKYTNTSNPKIRIGMTFNLNKKKIYSFDDNDGSVDTSSGRGKVMKDNIEIFMKGGKIEPMSFEKLLKKDPVIIFDKNKKLFLLDLDKDGKSKDVKKINEFMGFEKEWEPRGYKNYLLTIDGRFNKYIWVSGYYILACDGREIDPNPLINQKVFYELTKYHHDNKLGFPNNLVPLAIKMGLATKEGIVLKNKGCLFIKKDQDHSEYLITAFTNAGNKLVINIMDTDINNNKSNSNIFITYKMNRPKNTISDISNIFDNNYKGFSDCPIPPTSKTQNTLDTIIGLDNLRRVIESFYASELAEKKERERLLKAEQQKIEQKKLAEIERQRLEKEEYDKTHPGTVTKIKNWLGF